MKQIVIGFSGKIGSGKSTLSSVISERLDIPRVSFGDYIRTEARKRNILETRKNLQDLGNLFFTDRLREFCINVLFQDNWDKKSSLIVDGIRHLEVKEIIKEIVHPMPVALIFIDVKDEVRKERMPLSKLSAIDNHPTEYQVLNTLRGAAELIVDSDQGIPSTENQIIKWLVNFSDLNAKSST